MGGGETYIDWNEPFCNPMDFIVGEAGILGSHFIMRIRILFSFTFSSHFQNFKDKVKAQKDYF